MQTDRLYRVTEYDIPNVIRTLTECFQADPLYRQLIPDADVRQRTLPEIFNCDANEMLSTRPSPTTRCGIFPPRPSTH